MSEIKIIRADITDLDVDCIVNAADKTLSGGGGVDGAIHRKAGPKLLEECRTLGGCETSEAKLTKGYDLRAKYIIHTVGPIYDRRHDEECKTALRDCYLNCLRLAEEHGDIHSIAFPAISTGAYRFPLVEATGIAMRAINDFLSSEADIDLKIILCCYDDETLAVYQSEISNYER